MLDLAGARGTQIERRMLSAHDLLDADEAFLTNSSWGVLPVTGVIGLGDKKPIGRAEPGPLTMQLRADLLAEIERAASHEPEDLSDDTSGDHHDSRS
jgi:branched-subunit amino acid aminotransferase/4-amino-4-deoxychorismate lyase